MILADFVHPSLYQEKALSGLWAKGLLADKGRWSAAPVKRIDGTSVGTLWRQLSAATNNAGGDEVQKRALRGPSQQSSQRGRQSRRTFRLGGAFAIYIVKLPLEPCGACTGGLHPLFWSHRREMSGIPLALPPRVQKK